MGLALGSARALRGPAAGASIRRRKLPAEHAVWLVIGLALFRDTAAVAGGAATGFEPGWTSAARTRRQRANPPAPGRGPLAELFVYLAKPGTVLR